MMPHLAVGRCGPLQAAPTRRVAGAARDPKGRVDCIARVSVGASKTSWRSTTCVSTPRLRGCGQRTSPSTGRFGELREGELPH